MSRAPIATALTVLILALPGIVPLPATAADSELEGPASLVAELNARRASVAAPPLRHDPGLDRAAQAYATDLLRALESGRSERDLMPLVEHVVAARSGTNAGPVLGGVTRLSLVTVAPPLESRYQAGKVAGRFVAGVGLDLPTVTDQLWSEELGSVRDAGYLRVGIGVATLAADGEAASDDEAETHRPEEVWVVCLTRD
jgi:hypothetical protein